MQKNMPDGSIRGYAPSQQQPKIQCPQSPQPYQSKQYQQPIYQMPQEQIRAYQQDPYQKKPKRDILLLVSAIVAVVWFIVVCSSFASLMDAAPSGDEMDQLAHEIGTSIGFVLQIPFLITSFLAIVFNALGWLISKKGFALTAGVLFSVSVFLSIGNAIGYIPCLVMCFIGYSRLKKQAV